MAEQILQQIEILGKKLKVRCSGNPQELITAIFTTTRLVGYKINSSFSWNNENEPVEFNICIAKSNVRKSDIELNIKINHRIHESSGMFLRIGEEKLKYFPSNQLNNVLQKILENL